MTVRAAKEPFGPGGLPSIAVDALVELEYLQRLALTAAQTLDPPSLVRLVIAETTDAMGVDVCSIYLTEPDGETLVLSATNGLSQGGVGRVRLRIGEGVTGTAAAERGPVVVEDVRTEPRFRWLAGVDQARFVSMCSVPIISAGRLVGVLNVQTEEMHRFGRDEVAFMAAIAAQVAGALERSGLQERLEAQVADLRRSEEIHHRFTELALTGGGLPAICEEIARQAGGPVALFDDEGERLAPLPDPLHHRGPERRRAVLELPEGDEVVRRLSDRGHPAADRDRIGPIGLGGST